MSDNQLDLTAVRTYPQTGSCTAIAATVYAPTLAAGAAGTFVDVYIPFHPIADSHGADVAVVGDTSLVITSTAFTNEVSPSKKDSEMSNGDFWVNYQTGHVRCKKATNTTSFSAAYNIFQVQTNATLQAGDIEIGAVELKNGASDLRAIINPANTARSATDNVVLVQTIDETGGVGSTSKNTYNTTKPTLSNGDKSVGQCNVNGALDVNETLVAKAEDNTNQVIATATRPLASATYAPSEFKNLGANTTLNIKATAGNMISLYTTNANAAVRYLQLHKTATVPAGGAVPAFSIPIPPAASGTPGVAGWSTTDFTDMGIHSTLGWAFAISTTPGTFTNSATAGEHFTNGVFI